MSNAKKTRVSSPAPPVAISKGRYAIHETPEGDGVITYRPDGEAADQHQVIPSGIFSVLMKAAKGEAIDLNPMQIMKMLMGGR